MAGNNVMPTYTVTYQSATAARPLDVLGGLEHLRHQARHQNRRVGIRLRHIVRTLGTVSIRIFEAYLRFLQHIEEPCKPHAGDFLFIEEQILQETNVCAQKWE